MTQLKKSKCNNFERASLPTDHTVKKLVPMTHMHPHPPTHTHTHPRARARTRTNAAASPNNNRAEPEPEPEPPKAKKAKPGVDFTEFAPKHFKEGNTVGYQLEAITSPLLKVKGKNRQAAACGIFVHICKWMGITAKVGKVRTAQYSGVCLKHEGKGGGERTHQPARPRTHARTRSTGTECARVTTGGHCRKVGG